MLYGEYVKKVRRVRDFLDFLRLNRLRIAAICAAVLLPLLAFLLLRGIPLGAFECRESVLYGESIEPEAKALFSRVRYEYAAADGGDWSATTPVRSGEYRVRAISNGGFGDKNIGEKTFTISKREAEVIVNSVKAEFGAEELYPEQLFVTENLAPGDSVAVAGVDVAELTPGGIHIDKNNIMIVNSLGENMTDEYYLKSNSADITVYKRRAVVASVSIVTEYTGAPIGCEDLTVVGGSLGRRHRMVAEFDNAQENIGVVDNSFSLRIFSGDRDVSEHYNLTLRYGVLKINPRKITVGNDYVNKEYDGLPISFRDICRLDYGSLIDGHRLVINDAYGDIVNAGVYYPLFTASVQDREGNDVSFCYDINYSGVAITINRKVITVKTPSVTKVFDGEAIPFETAARVTLETPLLSGHHIEVAPNREYPFWATVEPNGDNYMQLSVKSGQTDVTANYEFVFDAGYLTIKQRPLRITTGSAEFLYDGYPHFCHEYTVEPYSAENERGLLPKHELSIYFNTSVKHVNEGKVENRFDYIIQDSEESQWRADQSANYEIEFVYGTLQILPLRLSVSTGSVTKMYDGTPAVSDPEFVITDGTLVPGEKAWLAPLSERALCDVGIYKNERRLTVMSDSGEDSSGDYLVEYDYGLVEITPRPITITSNSAVLAYNGRPQYYESFTVSDLPFDQTASVKFSGAQENVGECLNSIESVFIAYTKESPFYVYDSNDSSANETTENYIITYQLGTITVTPRRVTVAAGSAAKVYDGTPLVCGGYAIEGGSLASKHIIDITNVGSRTKIGTSDNIISEIKIFNAYNGEDVTANYSITRENGVLVVVANEWDLPVFDNVQSGSDGLVSGVGSEILKDGSFGNGDSKPILIVYSEEGGRVYLRLEAYGAYTGSGWEAAPIFKPNGTPVNPLYLPESVLREAGYNGKPISIELINSDYLTPYYSNGRALNNDVRVLSAETRYTLNYINYDYLNDSAYLRVSSEQAALEEEYRKFVYLNYLDVDEKTQFTMLEYAQANNVRGSGRELIASIAECIKSAGKYNPDFKPYPKGYDPAVYFLTVANEGVCQHFASAAVLMYRSFGIPARYTVGCVAETEAGKWVEVFSESIHAWVEVYVNGFGWIMVEVTADGPGGGSSGIGGGIVAGGTGVPENIDADLVIYVGSAVKDYDGTPLTCDKYRIAGSLPEGYSIYVTLKGSITDVGICENTVASVDIFDSYNNIVTSQFVIVFVTGTLTVNRRSITICSNSKIGQYTGEPLTDGGWTITNGSVAPGDTITVEVTGSQTEINESENTISSVVITRGRPENNVTKNYTVICIPGTLTVIT